MYPEVAAGYRGWDRLYGFCEMERDKGMKVVDAPLLQPRCPPKM